MNLFLPIVLGLIFILIYGAFFIVKQQTAAIIETFGRFSSVKQSGLQVKIPIVQRISGRLSLKIQQLDVIIETKTLDNVFVKLKVSSFCNAKGRILYQLHWPSRGVNCFGVRDYPYQTATKEARAIS